MSSRCTLSPIGKIKIFFIFTTSLCVSVNQGLGVYLLEIHPLLAKIQISIQIIIDCVTFWQEVGLTQQLNDNIQSFELLFWLRIELEVNLLG